MEEGLISLVDIYEHKTIAPSFSDLAFFHNGPRIRYIFPHQQWPFRLNSLCKTVANVVFCFVVFQLLQVLLGRDAVYNVKYRLFRRRSAVRRNVFSCLELQRNIFAFKNCGTIFNFDVDFSFNWGPLLLGQLFEWAYRNAHHVYDHLQLKLLQAIAWKLQRN